jgi:glucose/mannose-6-phosphate isomerase
MRTGQATLDDPSAIKAADPGGMLAVVGGLGSQLREGFDLGRGAAGLPSAEGVGSIAVCGMGGSGVVGDVLKASLADRLSVPVVTVKGYRLPAFCSAEDSLVLAVSYSGDTEETLAAYAQAVAAGCRVVVVSSGGELAGLAEADGVPHVALPGTVPAPRAALGYLAGAAIGILERTGLVADAGAEVGRASEALEALGAELGPGRQAGVNRAKSLALWLLGRIPLVWGSEGEAEAAALRWKTQFNENAKLPAFSAVLPELDHNDVEGWTGEMGRSFGLVVLRHGREHPRIAPRVAATVQAIAGSGLESREVLAEGSTSMEIVFSLVMLGDFVSTYLAVLRGVDPMPVRVLTRLKERLRS